MDPSFPPFENLDITTGRVVGLDADLAAALGGELGIKTEIVSLGFDELIDAVAAHRIDAAISALPVLPERTQDVRFSAPYVQAGVVLAVPQGSRDARDRGPWRAGGWRWSGAARATRRRGGCLPATGRGVSSSCRGTP